MNTSSYFVEFVEEVKNNNMTPIEILNWYRNFYHTENDNTEQGIMVNAINDIFMRLKKGQLNISNKDYKVRPQNKEENKIFKEVNNDKNTFHTYKKLIELIDILLPLADSLFTLNHRVSIETCAALELLRNELEAENNRIESEKRYI